MRKILKEIYSGYGVDNDAIMKITGSVGGGNKKKVQEAISKANLIHLAEQEESIRLSFAKLKNGAPVPYSLQTIRTRESDHHHLVIGVKQERDGQDGGTE